ncbi:uncharacterized protein LOC143912649 [Arctopsyche grandis]|uniref:uncharacterized protein LOC143912649 n=1 Tax=Arctopsyche grandis TaxID=121162 RepID=UPI00406D761F
MQSPSQLNSILNYDFASLLDDQFVTASGSRTITPSITSDRLSGQPLGVYNFSNASNGVPYRIKKNVEVNRYTTVMVEPIRRPNGEPRISYNKDNNTCKVDLIHDDWFGLAPLASPESLSELSSISSRTSLCQSNEKAGSSVVTIASVSRDTPIQPLLDADILLNDYALSTPKVLRRTPKIPGNLSTCADDIKNVVKYQKMNQNFRFLGRRFDGSLSGSSRESSFESATSAESGQLATVRTVMPIVRSPLKYIPSLDRSDGSLRMRKPDCMQSDLYNVNVKEGFYSAENIIESKASDTNFVTKSDSNILEVVVIGPNESSNVSSKYENGSAIVHTIEAKGAAPMEDVSTSSEIFLSTKSSMQSYESFDNQTNLIAKKALLTKEKNIYGSSVSSEGSPLHRNPRGEGAKLLDDSETDKEKMDTEEDEQKKKICTQKKRCKSISERNIFSQRNESLPLLSNIGSSITHSPPASYVKRKKYVYPVSSVFSKGESSV